MEYTLQELITEWKIRRGLEPLRIDASIKRQDAFEIDEYARRDIDRWYDRLLMTAPVGLLVVEDISDRVTVESDRHGAALMQLPGDCCRLVEVMMTGWKRPATIVGADSRLGRMQLSPFVCGGSCAPVAVTESGGRVRLYSFKNGLHPVADRVMAVMRPPEGIYRCQPEALYGLGIENKKSHYGE